MGQRSREEIRGLGYVGSSPHTLNLYVLRQYPQSLGDSCLHISELHGDNSQGPSRSWAELASNFRDFSLACFAGLSRQAK